MNLAYYLKESKCSKDLKARILWFKKMKLNINKSSSLLTKNCRNYWRSSMKHKESLERNWAIQRMRDYCLKINVLYSPTDKLIFKVKTAISSLGVKTSSSIMLSIQACYLNNLKIPRLRKEWMTKNF